MLLVETLFHFGLFHYIVLIFTQSAISIIRHRELIFFGNIVNIENIPFVTLRIFFQVFLLLIFTIKKVSNRSDFGIVLIN